MKKEDFEAIHGKVPPNTLYIDLDEQNPVEITTHGWSDEMILRKTEDELNGLISQRETGLAALRQNVDNEEDEISKLRDILVRRQLLKAT